jgi:hypothetical protein
MGWTGTMDGATELAQGQLVALPAGCGKTADGEENCETLNRTEPRLWAEGRNRGLALVTNSGIWA